MQAESYDLWAGYSPASWFKHPSKNTPGIFVRGVNRDSFGHRRRVEGKVKTVPITDQFGNPVTTIGEAKAAVERMKGGGQKKIDSNIRFAELVALHADDPSLASGKNTLKADADRLRLYASGLDKMKVQAISKHDVKRIVVKPMLDKGLSSNTISGALTAVSKQFSYAMRIDLLHVNPVRELQVHHDYPAPETKVVPRILTLAEFDAVLNALVRSPGMRVLIALLGYGGLRSSEAAGMTWEQLLDEDGQLTGQVTVTGQLDKETREIVNPKTKASVGTVHTPQALTDILRWEWHRQGRPTTGLVCKTKGNNCPLFESKEPKPFHSSAVSEQLRRACSKAGIAEPFPRPHDLRHTFASLLMSMVGNGEGQLPIAYVATQTRHKNVATLLATYTHEFGAADNIGKAGRAIDALRAQQQVAI